MAATNKGRAEGLKCWAHGKDWMPNVGDAEAGAKFAALRHDSECDTGNAMALHRIGNWLTDHFWTFLVHTARISRSIPAFVVLLPGAAMPERGGLPRFLSRLTWVDFRGPQGLRDTDAFGRLLADIRGEPPGRTSRIAAEREYRMLPCGAA